MAIYQKASGTIKIDASLEYKQECKFIFDWLKI